MEPSPPVRPELTGLAPHQLQHLIHTLAPAGDTRRGRPPRLTFADQVLATVLHLRVNLAAEPFAVLFNSSRTAMHRTLLKTRKLLEAQGITHLTGHHPTDPPDSPPSPSGRPKQQLRQQDQSDRLMIGRP
ncbi:transposase family protein [Streptomyces sp. A0958]|uniref:transposase family protein n=1 Tax=Streptomyces sp. A0958 TaxID=2563101 RepID=UPI001F0D3802|nr:transposase family protein [Streptomyces sp. A0958]